ncbi:MAG: glutathione S-transferase family protein [Bradyrhizobium sp.]|nr:MAG: glutathione S-transferase family protein [Bradyrhizobium sp.]
MGVMVDGVWRSDDQVSRDPNGRFMRAETQFRDWVTVDGAPGPAGEGGFRAEPGRYYLYVSLACPWAHRALIFRALKGLEGIVGLSVVNWLLREDGWTFAPGAGVVADPVFGAKRLYELYGASRQAYTGRVTVPILFDKVRKRIVNNESAEIIRMFNSAFDGVGAAAGDFYPADLRTEIDALNARVYATVNNGVYRSGFAKTQSAYDEAATALFDTLDWLEARLADRRFLCGARATEADWRLFTTLVRFDPVYVGLFKCNLRRIADYPHLSRYFAELRAWPGVAETIDYFHIRHHYYESLQFINPNGIVPRGPAGYE